MDSQPAPTIKVSDYLCSRIADLTGSRHVFLLSGGGMMHLLDSVGRSELTTIPMHHEQAAAIAAYAYGRTVNSTGVCFATSGPGKPSVSADGGGGSTHGKAMERTPSGAATRACAMNSSHRLCQ